MNDQHDRLPEANFLNFLGGLASQGLMQLGKIPNPASGQRQVNLPFARYTVDLLRILRAKTEGNRSEEESRYLDGLLADLEHQVLQMEQQQQ
jgi:hypothetical protein